MNEEKKEERWGLQEKPPVEKLNQVPRGAAPSRARESRV